MDSSSLEGIELGKLVLSSGLLHSSWSKILEVYASNYPNLDPALGFKIEKEEKFTIVVFTAPPIRRDSSALTTLPGSQNQNPLHFLCSKKFPSFSVHTSAFELFASAYNENLRDLKSELLKCKKPVIITGAALGGCVASLFTLWLLETIDPKLKRPLCITFGSPLIGDASLQQILENSVWSSCFLHVADAAKPPITAGFTPIGTFLICFESECVCIEDHEAIMELLMAADSRLIPDDEVDYVEVLHRVDQSVFSMAADSRLIPADVINGIKIRVEEKKLRYDPAKQLNRVKVLMAYIEKYKQKSKELKTGYYDQYRSEIETELSIHVQGWKKEINEYWISLVELVEKKPQSDESILTRRFLLSGNNYRRLVEPLDIAEYYRDRREDEKEYRTSGRSTHYEMLEKWFKDALLKPDRSASSDLSHLLTFDSCFWAKVEDVMIVIDQLKAVEGRRDEVLIGKLVEFEEYVWGLIGEREVSPEIFLEKSSFMRWWKEYKVHSSPSDFTEFMNSEKYELYGKYIAP